MNILHICEYVDGGISTYLNELLSFQVRDKRISSVNVLMSKYNSKDIKVLGVNIYYYKYKRSPLYFLSAIIQIQRVINKIKPDIIHIHSTFAGFFTRIPYFLGIKKKYPIVYCSHGWAFLMDIGELKKKIYVFIERLLSRQTDLIINISNHELLGSLKYGISKQKSVVIPNGISQKYHKLLNQEELNLNLDNSKINLLFVGRFDKQKGLDLLLDFFSNYTFRKIKLYLIGSKVLNKKKIKIPKNVTSLGWVNNEIIDSYYEKFDAIIIPSRWEGFGLVAIEAMKNKKAIIASRRGALQEIVHPGQNGLLFEIKNSFELKNIMENLSKNKLEKMGEKGYEFFVNNYTSDKMNKRIIKIYLKLQR